MVSKSTSVQDNARFTTRSANPFYLPAKSRPCSAATTCQRSDAGFVIDHPERLSGSWEVKGDHAIYGLHIQLTTRVDGAPITLIGVQQIFHSALIEVYERTGPTRKVWRRELDFR